MKDAQGEESRAIDKTRGVCQNTNPSPSDFLNSKKDHNTCW